MLDVLAILLPLSSLLLFLVWPVLYVKRAGRYGITIMIVWLCMLIWAVLNAVIFPVLLTQILDDTRVSSRFMSGQGVIVMLLGGWIPGLYFIGCTALFRLIKRLIGSRKTQNTEQDAAPNH